MCFIEFYLYIHKNDSVLLAPSRMVFSSYIISVVNLYNLLHLFVSNHENSIFHMKLCLYEQDAPIYVCNLYCQDT